MNIKNIALVMLLLNAVLSCNALENDYSSLLVNVYTIPRNPVIKSGDNFDYHFFKPHRREYYINEYNEGWTLDDYEEFEYKESDNQLEIFEKTFDSSEKLESYFRINLQIDDQDRLISLQLFNMEENIEVSRKKVTYNENEIYIEVFSDDKLKWTYNYSLDENKNVSSFTKNQLSPFSGKWQISFSDKFIYDSNHRLIKIIYESGETEIFYDSKGNLIFGGGNNPSTIYYDDDGRLIREHYTYPSGSERDLKEIVYNYNVDGLIESIITTNSYKGEMIRATKEVFSY